MKRRIGVLLVVFVVSLALGLLGPAFLERRRAELEVRAWYRSAKEEPLPWEVASEDRLRLEELMELRQALERAFEEYEDRDLLSLDAFPNETIVAYLAEGELPAEDRERDASEYVAHLCELLEPYAELLAETSFRPIRVPEFASLEEASIRMHEFPGLRIWMDLLIFHALARPDDRDAVAGLGTAMDLARVCDTGVMIGLLLRGGLEAEILEVTHDLLAGGEVSAAHLREELEPRFARSASSGKMCSPIEAERRILCDSFDAILGEEPVCAGFSGDFVPILELVRSVEEARVNGELAPRDYLAHARRVQAAGELSIYGDYLQSGQFQLALLEMGRIELALAAFREREGAWPERLEQLDPLFSAGRPRDPHTGEDFPYVRDGAGIALGPPAIGELAERGGELVRRLP